MKKFLAIILSLILVFSLSACGEKQDNKVEEPKVTLKEQLQGIINGEFETPKNIIFIIGGGGGEVT